MPPTTPETMLAIANPNTSFLCKNQLSIYSHLPQLHLLVTYSIMLRLGHSISNLGRDEGLENSNEGDCRATLENIKSEELLVELRGKFDHPSRVHIPVLRGECLEFERKHVYLKVNIRNRQMQVRRGKVDGMKCEMEGFTI